MQGRYAEVIVDNRSVLTDKPFTYGIKPDMTNIIKEGMRVIVPFGRGNKNIKGIVVNILDEFSGNYKLKNIIDTLDEKPLVSKNLLSLSKWMKKTYLSSYLDALQPVLPPGDFKEIETFISYTGGDASNLSREEKLVLSYLYKKDRVDLPRLKKDLSIPGLNQILEGLEDRKLVSINIDISTRISKKTERWVKIVDSSLSLEEKREMIGSRAKKQLKILDYIIEKENTSLKNLLKDLNTSDSTVKEVEKKGLIEIFNKEVTRDAVKKDIEQYKKHKLNREQDLVFIDIIRNINIQGGYNKFLIHGITGSGKTEIYLQLVEDMLKKGKDSIILVPEISLTPQTIDRFVGRFQSKVAVLHSSLSSGERFDQWRLIKEGRVKIVVGARSAVFAPFNNLGLIVIDEEHETTYKSSNNPKYDTVQVAGKRADIEGASLVLGTATPSIETYYRAKKQEIKLYELNKRANESELAEVEVVDMREELNDGNRSIFSRNLYKSIDYNLKTKKQTILFLNRRGFSTFVSCRTCGYVVKCSDCEVAMTYHSKINRLKCHYCGKTEVSPIICPSCGSKYIKYFGIGTERVEEITKELFPMARVARMDADTMVRKASYEKTLEKMKMGEIDILIGTQMISKGLDFKDVTLVGIIAADVSLNLPDFKSPERTFQLITQVAGRAGRGEDKGRVILQTYNPNHYSIVSGKNQDYKSFYEMEINLRKEFFYPPYSDIISILLYGKDNIKVSSAINSMSKFIKKNIFWLDIDEISANVIGPYPSPIEKIRNNFRWQLIIKSDKKYLSNIKSLIEKVCIENEYGIDLGEIKVSIDINPSSIL